MAVIIKKERWKTVPTQAVEVDYNNPIGAKIYTFFLFGVVNGSIYNAAKAYDTIGLMNTPYIDSLHEGVATVKPSALGKGMDLTGCAYSSPNFMGNPIYNDVIFGKSNPPSCGFGCDIDVVQFQGTQQVPIFVVGGLAEFSGFTSLQLGYLPNVYGYAQSFYGQLNLTDSTNVLCFLPFDSRSSVKLFNYNNPTLTAFLEGKPYATNTGTGASIVNEPGEVTFGAFRVYPFQQSFQGCNIRSAFTFSNALTNDEALEFNNAPYSVLKPIVRKSFYIPKVSPSPDTWVPVFPWRYRNLKT